MEKIRIAHLINRLDSVGFARTAVDIINRTNASQYQFLIICGKKPALDLFRNNATRSSPQIEIQILPELSKTFSFVNYINTLSRLRHILANWKPDILHIHSIKVGMLGALAARLAGVKSILYASQGLLRNYRYKRRGYDLFPWYPQWWMAKIPALLSDVIITMSPHELEEELALGFGSRSKYRIIYNAIQPERFESGRHDNPEVLKYRLGLDPFFPILGTAARLDREKGIEFLLEAVAQLKLKFPDIVLLIMGDGPLREHLLVMAKRLDITSQVRFLGLRDDVPTLLRILDIFVLPSLYEATGIVLAEAMALGRPVVSTRVGGLPQIIHNGEDGFLVPPADVMRLVEKITRLSKDRELAARMGEKAAQKARSLFDMQKMISDYEGLYQMLSQKKRG